MSAKFKITALIGLLFTLTILLVTTRGFVNFKAASESGYNQRLDDRSFLISKAIEQKMDRYFDAMYLVASKLKIDKSGVLDINDMVESLHTLHKRMGVVDTYMATKTGVTYTSSLGDVIPDFNAAEKQREWFVRPMNGDDFVVTKPYVSTSGKAVMAIAIPIKKSGEAVGVLGLDIYVETISNFIKSLTPQNHISISRDDGYLLAAHDPKLIGKDLFDLHPSYSKYQKNSRSNHTYTFKGEDFSVFSTRVDSLGWSVWSWDKWSEIKALSNKNLIESLLITLALLILSLAIVYAIVIKIMYKPVGGEPSDIEALMEKVAQGELASVGIATGKETGIYKAVLAMVANLKDMIEHINITSAQLNASSTEMTESAGNVSNCSESQMQQLEQASTAMNEMTVTVEEVARNALEASTAADKANNHSADGIVVVDEMNENIITLVEGITDVQTVVGKLESEINNISSIVEVIHGISDQTNLLALNAAIEAARAGEHGRGFAVVADEVRSLANRTQDSTNEIQNMINSLQEESKNSVTLMQKNVDNALVTVDKSTQAAEALQAIRSSVSVIHEMNNLIATSAEEQTLVAGEINISIVGINDLAKITFDGSEQAASRAHELSGVAHGLSESVSVFKF